MKQDNPQISLIIPAKGFPQVLSETLDALSNQTLMPQEVVIVDSSKKGEIDDVILDFQDKINIKHIKVKKAYPGEARNLAIKESVNEILAFVDSKTVPETDWLEASFSQLSKDIDVIFGKQISSFFTNSKNSPGHHLWFISGRDITWNNVA